MADVLNVIADILKQDKQQKRGSRGDSGSPGPGNYLNQTHTFGQSVKGGYMAQKY